MNSLKSTENTDFPGVKDVTIETTREQQQDLFLVDVRRPDERSGELGHIEKSLHIVLDELPQRFHEIPKDKDIVLICRSGQRSAQASLFLAEQGYPSTFNMKGGMIAWNEAKFPTQS